MSVENVKTPTSRTIHVCYIVLLDTRRIGYAPSKIFMYNINNLFIWHNMILTFLIVTEFPSYFFLIYCSYFELVLG